MTKILVKLALATIAVFGMGVAQATDFLFSDPGSDTPSNLTDLDTTTSTGDYITDGTPTYIEYSKDGLVFQVSGTTDGTTTGVVIQDLQPDWGGLAINDGPTDNMNDGETLTIALTSGGGILLNSVSFFDENHGIPVDQFTVCNSCFDVKLEIFLGGDLVTTLMWDLTMTQASFDVGFHGDEFKFTALTDSDNFYISAINVPEPGTLALLGLGLLGFGFARRRKTYN